MKLHCLQILVTIDARELPARATLLQAKIAVRAQAHKETRANFL